MSPFRQATPGKHFRLLLAVMLAAAVHAALVIIEFSPPPAYLPAVSLPRSVSVSLGQRSAVDKPVLETEKVLPLEEPAKVALPIKPESVEPVEKPIMPLPEKEESLPEAQIQPVQPATVPEAEKPVLPVQKEETIAAEIATDNSGSEAVSEPVKAAVAAVLPENPGVPLTGTVQEAFPRYRLNSPPPYPGMARKRGQQGTVILQVLVNREGGVDDLQVEESSGFGLLDRAAVKAVRKWHFEPGRRGDTKVTMRVRVPVKFTLK